MELGMIQLMKMKQSVERILHVPGNYKGGILEMALIIDCNMSKETAKTNVQAIVKALKSHSEVFRNVRLNVVWWKSDEEILTEVFQWQCFRWEQRLTLMKKWRQGKELICCSRI